MMALAPADPVADHVLYGEVFDDDHVMVADQPRWRRCRKSARDARTFRCARATFALALARFAEPRWQRASLRWYRARAA